MAIALLFIAFGLLLVIGVPVAFALAAASLATLVYLDVPTIVLVQQVSAGSGSASLIAIPLFIFAGEIMLRGGISERLIGLANSLVGRMRGGSWSFAKSMRQNGEGIIAIYIVVCLWITIARLP